ncbi:Eco57I restriction-modification methylase domain-containing protein, partial [Streptomyces nigra]
MTGAMQKQFKSFSKLRHLWSGGAVATQQDLVALFIARTVEQFLSPSGSFAFVAPKSILSRMQYSGFRSGKWATNLPDPVTKSEVTVRVAFDRAWDLEEIEPDLFPVPSAVVRGKRVTYAKELPAETVRFRGNLPARATRWSEAQKKIKSDTGTVRAVSADSGAQSPYDSVTFNGATIYPRSLFFVQKRESGPLGVAQGLTPVRSLRTSLEKPPWKELPDLVGTVESVFVRDVLLGSTVLPYRAITPWQAVLPILNDALLSEESIRNHEHLAEWWEKAESRWEAHKGAQNKLTLMERLNYQRGLTRQLGKGQHRVIYAKSGGTLAASYVNDPSLILENGLYWLVVPDAATAHYLVAILNSQHVLDQVSTLQSRGLLGARHFDKYVWHLPIPRFNEKDALHQEISRLGEEAQSIAARVEIPEGVGFQRARSLIKAGEGRPGRGGPRRDGARGGRRRG